MTNQIAEKRETMKPLCGELYNFCLQKFIHFYYCKTETYNYA